MQSNSKLQRLFCIYAIGFFLVSLQADVTGLFFRHADRWIAYVLPLCIVALLGFKPPRSDQ